MKKKLVIISVLIIISICIMYFIRNNMAKQLLEDSGVVLAITLDGNTVSEFPSSGKYHIDINCTNAVGTWVPDVWELSLTNITGDVTCDIDFTTKKSSHSLTAVVQNAIPNNNFNSNGYRYTGKNPNNYISFNGELWRIIGVLTPYNTTTALTKIIRDEPLGKFSYDVIDSWDNANALWGRNTLYSLLNSHYFSQSSSASQLNGSTHEGCYSYYDYDLGVTPKANCDFSKTGIVSTSYYGKMVKSVYWYNGEVSNSYTASSIYTSEAIDKSNITSGYIGIMSLSDYAYASDSSYHNSDISSNKTHTSANWLYTGLEEHTMTRYQNSYANWYISSSQIGSVSNMNVLYGSFVRPTLYLNSSVYVISGTGTIFDPYTIGM